MCDKAICDSATCDSAMCDSAMCDKAMCDTAMCDKVCHVQAGAAFAMFILLGGMMLRLIIMKGTLATLIGRDPFDQH